MGWGEGDVYYSPENFGLKTVGELDFSDGCYNFDTTCIWTNDKGELYWADDAGCSCPSPFEGYTSVESLEHGPLFRLQEHLIERYKARDSDSSVTMEHVRDVIDKSMRAVEAGQLAIEAYVNQETEPPQPTRPKKIIKKRSS